MVRIFFPKRKWRFSRKGKRNFWSLTLTCMPCLLLRSPHLEPRREPKREREEEREREEREREANRMFCQLLRAWWYFFSRIKKRKKTLTYAIRVSRWTSCCSCSNVSGTRSRTRSDARGRRKMPSAFAYGSPPLGPCLHSHSHHAVCLPLRSRARAFSLLRSAALSLLSLSVSLYLFSLQFYLFAAAVRSSVHSRIFRRFKRLKSWNLAAGNQSEEAEAKAKGMALSQP